MISKARNKGYILGLKFLDEVIITRFLFVYDVILFGLDNIRDWKVLHSLLDLFCNATGMEVNPKKYCSYTYKARLELIT